jgi:hypothetical protein
MLVQPGELRIEPPELASNLALPRRKAFLMLTVVW